MPAVKEKLSARMWKSGAFLCYTARFKLVPYGTASVGEGKYIEEGGGCFVVKGTYCYLRIVLHSSSSIFGTGKRPMDTNRCLGSRSS